MQFGEKYQNEKKCLLKKETSIEDGHRPMSMSPFMTWRYQPAPEQPAQAVPAAYFIQICWAFAFLLRLQLGIIMSVCCLSLSFKRWNCEAHTSSAKWQILRFKYLRQTAKKSKNFPQFDALNPWWDIHVCNRSFWEAFCTCAIVRSKTFPSPLSLLPNHLNGHSYQCLKRRTGVLTKSTVEGWRLKGIAK